MKRYVEDYWKENLKKVLRGKELPLEDVIKRLNSPRSTVQRYVDLFVAKNILEDRKEGKQKFVKFKG